VDYTRFRAQSRQVGLLGAGRRKPRENDWKGAVDDYTAASSWIPKCGRLQRARRAKVYGLDYDGAITDCSWSGTESQAHERVQQPRLAKVYKRTRRG
jgi:hypothetical protein